MATKKAVVLAPAVGVATPTSVRVSPLAKVKTVLPPTLLTVTLLVLAVVRAAVSNRSRPVRLVPVPVGASKP